MKNKFSFKNKNIIITGGNGKIGIKLCKTFLDLGANIIITDINTSVVKNFSAKKKIKYIQCDLNIENERSNLIDEIKKYKKIDIVINNAAVTGSTFASGWNSVYSKQTLSNWNKALNVNITSVFHLIKAIIPNLKKSSDPNIVNISSIYGIVAPNYEIYKNTKLGNPAAYSTSKAALIYFSKWLATTLAPKIRVNCISPGGIFRNQEKKFVKSYINTVPLKRMANEEDIINSILFLTSPMSSYITGHNLIVDGGKTIQ